MSLKMGSYIRVKCEMAGRELVFLLDTGASISLVKFNKLFHDFPINSNSISNIQGIKKGYVQTLGLTNSRILIDNFDINHSFHVVDNEFPIPADGIMGLDFIRNFKCQIDYENWRLTIRRNNFHDKLTIPIYDQPSTNSNDNENVFAIPARCEVVRRVNIITDDGQKVIPNQEIEPGVFIGRCIVDRHTTCVRILNTKNENVILTNPKISVEDLSDYVMFNIIFY